MLLGPPLGRVCLLSCLLKSLYELEGLSRALSDVLIAEDSRHLFNSEAERDAFCVVQLAGTPIEEKLQVAASESCDCTYHLEGSFWSASNSNNFEPKRSWS